MGRSRMSPKRTAEPPTEEESGITYFLNGNETDLFHFFGFLRRNVKLGGYSIKEAKISKVSSG
jgi:hypothetical protein